MRALFHCWRAMLPCYHFNVYDHANLPDQDGTELRDIEVALQEALRLAGALIVESAFNFMPGDEWRMEVTDETGLVLFRLDFNVSKSPAVPGMIRA